MKFINSFSILIFIFILAGCTDDLIFNDNNGDFEEGPLVEAYLSLAVNNYTISSDGTRAEIPSDTTETATNIENRIDNIWLFQYDSNTGMQLIKPAYYRITNQETLKNLKVLLKDGISSKICVVANTGDASWCVGKDFSTLDKLQAMALPNPQPIKDSELSSKGIPMEGSSDNITVSSGSDVKVSVKRMFAKLRIGFKNYPEGMSPYSVEVTSIPGYCRVEALDKGLSETDAASYDFVKTWVTRTFNADESTGVSGSEKKEFVLYIPENIQGETENTFDGEKNNNAPQKALVINVTMRYKNPNTNTEEEREYKVYPGGNNYNNFNVRRNCVYRVKININSASTNSHTSSSNCFVVIPGRGLSFEPYYRTETGGGYKIEDYLDPNDPNQVITENGETKTITGDKVIDDVKIVWQTLDAIGDNSNGDKIWFEKNEDDPLHSKLYVKTNKEGNALIAAYNAKKEIIWSWHIWITGYDPGNVGNSINYTTYRWDQDGIYPNERQPGYAVMKCNIGALGNGPTDPTNADTPNSSYVKTRRTSGMLYQWGRKDPFPPAKHRDNFGDYIMELYDNSNEKIKMTTYGYEFKNHEELFETVKVTDNVHVGSTKESGIKYSIKHPTIFIAGAPKLDYGSRMQASSYLKGGDWLPERDDCLWGGLQETDDMMSLELIEGGLKVHIRDNYGPEKTIFDPCPKGWRVPPGDLWLGFTQDGRTHSAPNVATAKEIFNIWKNYSYDNIIGGNVGFWLCLDGWHSNDFEKYSFFPTQGTRLASGQPFGQSSCGNYHNATVDGEVIYDEYPNYPVCRLNILHVHCEGTKSYISPFEYGVWYNLKSIGGPVRCVRDRL